MPKSSPKTKSKSPAKATASKPAKALKKEAKPIKSLVKTLVKAAGKVLAPKADKPKTSAKPAAPKPSKNQNAGAAPQVTAKPAKKDEKLKKVKKAKAPKKDSGELDLGDDLVGDEDLGTEDIPDLAEFEENEVEVEEDDSLDLLSNEGPKAPDEEIFLTDAEGRRYCRVRDCDQIGAVEGYCRFHYMQLWKRIQVRRRILVDGKLERYVEELTARYPDKFLEMIRKDLRAEKDFLAAIAELEIDESAVDAEFEDESANFIEEVRGVSENSPSMSDDDEY